MSSASKPPEWEWVNKPIKFESRTQILKTNYDPLITSAELRYMMGQYVTLHGEVISHVNISRTVVDDGGLYTCTATNRAGASSHSARLNIYGEYYLR